MGFILRRRWHMSATIVCYGIRFVLITFHPTSILYCPFHFVHVIVLNHWYPSPNALCIFHWYLYVIFPLPIFSNIIPAPKSVWYIFEWIRKKFFGRSKTIKKEHMKTIRVSQMNEWNTFYKNWIWRVETTGVLAFFMQRIQC